MKIDDVLNEGWLPRNLRDAKEDFMDITEKYAEDPNYFGLQIDPDWQSQVTKEVTRAYLSAVKDRAIKLDRYSDWEDFNEAREMATEDTLVQFGLAKKIRRKR